MKKAYVCFFVLVWAFTILGCASTSSVVINDHTERTSVIAIIPLDGYYGEQASDLIAEQMTSRGIPTVTRSDIGIVLREHGFRNNENFDSSSIAEYGKLIGVKKIFTGTITTAGGPLYSFPHVNMTLKAIDVQTGKVTWIGRYGNSMWTSAISTQGDIQRGAKHIVSEFVKVHGTNF